MKVLIVGAGVIGSIYGWALSKVGHTITHLVRQGRSDQFRNGIAIDMMDKRKGHKKWCNDIYQISVIETIPSKNDYEMVIIPVRPLRSGRYIETNSTSNSQCRVYPINTELEGYFGN